MEELRRKKQEKLSQFQSKTLRRAGSIQKSMKTQLNPSQKDEIKLEKKREIRQKYTVISKFGVVPKDFRGKLQNFVVNPDVNTPKSDAKCEEPAPKSGFVFTEGDTTVEGLNQKLKNRQKKPLPK